MKAGDKEEEKKEKESGRTVLLICFQQKESADFHNNSYQESNERGSPKCAEGSGLAVTQLAQAQAQHYASISPLSIANGG